MGLFKKVFKDNKDKIGRPGRSHFLCPKCGHKFTGGRMDWENNAIICPKCGRSIQNAPICR
jgi:DNA-directed RNA polymerase subunit RPC12/RpoP